MAHRLLKRYPRTFYKGSQEVKQHFNYLLVMDFEATCKQYEKLEPQEIIELPCMAVSTQTWQTENVFHEYIKPRVHPNLTPFCTHLTGIMQEMVENEPHFLEVFNKFCKWLDDNNYFKNGNDSAFLTCGDWDLKVLLPSQCKLDNVEVPGQFRKWINLKYAFCEATDYYPKGLKDMLVHLKLPLQGQLHSGIDDVKNMVEIAKALGINYNAQFKVNCAPDILNMYLKKARAP